MSTRLRSTLIILGLVFFSTNMFAQENPFKFKWDNGFKLESADKNFKLKFGGRVQWDNAFFFQDDSVDSVIGEFKNGTEFRRLRFFNSGTIYKVVDYKMQLDFAGKLAVKDAYITINGLPGIEHLRVGHFLEPFRLEAINSSKHLTLMERGLPVNFLPERNTGIMLFDEFADKRLSWQGGVFRRSDGLGNDQEANDGYALTTRFAGLPMVNEDKSQLLHLGAGITHRVPDDKEFSVSARPETHLGEKYVSTGTIEDVDNVLMFSAEAALVAGPFSVQGEYVQTEVTTSFEDLSFNGYYGQVSYFLTGEHRKYKSSLAGFDRVKPKNNFGEGPGAWEVALRYSGIDLNSGDVSKMGSVEGGEMTDITLGINWYLNPASKVMLNYIYSDVTDVGNASIVQARVQVDF